MSSIKIDTQEYAGRIYNIYQIVDYTSPDNRIALCVAYGIPLKDNCLQYLDEKYVKPYVMDMMDAMTKHEKVMVIVDISQFPIIAVSFVNKKDDLINDGADIGVKMNKVYDDFTWENKTFPLLFVNLNISHTGLCIFDYDNCKFVKS